jgi:hypothetical protein
MSKKTKLPEKSLVIELPDKTAKDIQKGVSTEQIQDKDPPTKEAAATTQDYTKEARRKQASDHRTKQT